MPQVSPLIKRKQSKTLFQTKAIEYSSFLYTNNILEHTLEFSCSVHHIILQQHFSSIPTHQTQPPLFPSHPPCPSRSPLPPLVAAPLAFKALLFLNIGAFLNISGITKNRTCDPQIYTCSKWLTLPARAVLVTSRSCTLQLSSAKTR